MNMQIYIFMLFSLAVYNGKSHIIEEEKYIENIHTGKYQNQMQRQSPLKCVSQKNIA